MQNRYVIGDKVLVSRAETGEDHELGQVVDSYELIIGEERKAMIVAEFEDGERKYIAATTPNVLPVEPEEDEPSEAGDEEVGVEPAAAEETPPPAAEHEPE